MKTVLIILFTHFVADFIFQTDKQALNKSSSNLWLFAHVSTYSVGLLLGGLFVFGFTQNLIVWMFLNGVIHFFQDWLTSRINAKLWKANKRHWFFVGIGADQFIHYCFLLLSYEYLQTS